MSSTASEQLFPGQYHDAETGLNYNYFRSYNPATGRYTQLDPIGLPGGLNRFVYVGNLPTVRADGLGLFWVTVHSTQTYWQARLAGMDSNQASTLANLTGGVDSLEGSQDPSNSEWHAMRDPSWSATEAEKKFDEWVSLNLEQCGLSSLAKAIHAIQDSYSPSHEGFQPWYGVDGSSLWDLIKHGAQDDGTNFPDAARLATRSAISDWMSRCQCGE